MAEQTEYNPATWEALAKRDGETLRAHAAFLDYVRMGPGRSLAKLGAQYLAQFKIGSGSEKPPTKQLATLRDWSARHEWQKRLKDWTAERTRLDEERWAQRRLELREADWITGEKLREQAEAALEQVPNFLTTKRRFVKGGEGQMDREVVTMGLRLGEVTDAAATASKLQRAAAEMPTDRVVHSGKVQVEDVSAVSQVTPEMAQAAQAALRAAIEAQARQNGEQDRPDSDGHQPDDGSSSADPDA